MSLNESYHFFDGYYISDLVLQFANLTHYGTNFKPNSDITILEETEYFQSIGMYLVIAGIVTFGLMLLMAGFCWYNCRFRSVGKVLISDKETATNNVRYWNILIIIVAVIGVGTFSSGFYAETRLHDSSAGLCHAVNFAYQKLANISSHLDIIFEKVDVKNQVNSLNVQMNETVILVDKIQNNQQIKDEMKILVESYDEIHKQMDKVADLMEVNITTESIPNMLRLVKQWDRDCDSNWVWTRVVTLTVLIVFSLVVLLFVLGIRHNGYRPVIATIGFVVMFLLMTFASIFFVLLVVGSDFCVISKTLIHKHLDDPLISYYVDHYYVYIFITSAQQSLITMESQLSQTIKNFCSTPGQLDDVCEHFHQIWEILNPTNNQSYSFNSRFETLMAREDELMIILNSCTTAPEVDDTLTLACTNLYQFFFYFFINATGASLCIYILIYLTTWLYFNYVIINNTNNL